MTPETLRICLENVDFRLPTQVTDDSSVVALKSLAFEPLLRWQPGGLAQPGLFSGWKISSDGKIWHFYIRDQALFHDGSACTATDVVKYINGLLDSLDYFGMRWSYARYFENAQISAEDDRIVKIENTEPFADVLDILCEFWPCKFDSKGKPVLGTGPYEVVEFERKNNIGKATLQLVRPNRHNGPHTIIASHEPDAEKRLNSLREGKVDVALNLERGEHLHLINFDPSLQWGRVTSTLSVIYYLNCMHGIFRSPEARLAVNLAVDTTKLVKEVYQQLALPSATVVSPFHLGSKEAQLLPIPHDPERARTLLAKLDTSTPLVLRTPTYMPEHAQKISRFVSSSLEAVGFKVEVKVETNRPEYARSIGIRKEIGDLALFDSTPNSTFRVLDDKISSTSRNTWWLGYHNEEMQELIALARKKVHNDERADAYAACLKKLQHNPPWLYIAHPDVVWAMRPGVSLKIGHSGVLTFQ
ncbi:hypothetical protein N0V90_010999 [Kalmusia sp. IMI 367209]|nr:hypothetical protein N0V90_010999 [Kalmusia sp. IMI 367209]